MAKLKVITDKNILHRVCKDVDMNDIEHCYEIANQLEKAFKDGECRMLGLSAIQLGIEENACLIRDKNSKKKFNIYFNLQVRDIKGWKKSNEGCLSEPGVRIDVQRPIECTVEYDTLDGRHCVRTLKYPDTRVWCHEADHAKGILLQDIGTFNAEETRLYATGAQIGAIKRF